MVRVWVICAIIGSVAFSVEVDEFAIVDDLMDAIVAKLKTRSEPLVVEHVLLANGTVSELDEEVKSFNAVTKANAIRFTVKTQHQGKFVFFTCGRFVDFSLAPKFKVELSYGRGKREFEYENVITVGDIKKKAILCS